jgi:homocysteine S-methyltransferase
MNIKYPLLLDGGLSNELEKEGYNLNHKLWTAKLLETNPEAIIQAHLAYLKAGAKCIITSSYQASIPGLMAAGYNQDTAEKMILETVRLAEIAIHRFQEIINKELKPLIAASIGPYGAFLADGSEYHGNYGISNAKLRSFHLERIQLLDHSNADFLACETIPSLQEALVLAEILVETHKPSWLSFSCKDDLHLNDGSPIVECVAQLSRHSGIFALGVNCTAPKYISGLIKAIKANAGSKKIVVYPNSGEIFNAESKTWQSCSDPHLFAALTKEWLALGADILGGCCRIGPDHISTICTEMSLEKDN